jgi:anti-sigma B factor antagonist
MELTPPFSLEASRIGSHRVIVVRGEVDLASAPELDTTLAKFKGQEVFVDLRKVEFMDSAGLRVLLTQQARIQEQGGNLRLVVTEGPVMRLLELAGVRDSFSIRPTINSQDSQDT